MNSFRTLLLLPIFSSSLMAAEPLHQQIDQLILAQAEGKKPSSRTEDGEFLRRIYLDFAGKIPSTEEARKFLADPSTDKRARLIERLLVAPEYARQMTDAIHLMYMERLGDHAEWTKYLQTSFEKNKPWNQMAREILRADPKEEANRGASFFLAKRLDHYGQNAIDYPALTRDVGRLFLGKDFRCAQCHDHLFIKQYKQKDFQGLFAFFQNASLQDLKSPMVAEKPTISKMSFMSVFNKMPKETGLMIPGGKEHDIPPQPKGEEYVIKPDPKKLTPGELKFSPLVILAEELPKGDLFARNAVNRFWFLLVGRGIVHPLDLHHDDNPPSHSELIDLLSKEFVGHQFDVKWLLKEIALSETYQRSSRILKGEKPAPPESFLTGLEKRLSAEQLLASFLQASGSKPENMDNLKARFLKAFANPPREPEEEFVPSLKGSLFLLNDPTLLEMLNPKPGNLVDRLSKLTDPQVAEELYLTILTRLPNEEEKKIVEGYLKKNASRRVTGLSQLAWALFASTEFATNH